MEVATTHNNSGMQMLSIQESKEWYNSFVSFTKEILKKDLDYGIIPNTPKPSLYKPGAEKLRFVYGLGVEFETVENEVLFDPLFVDYTYKCTIRSKQGQILSQCEGNCNSQEAKFGWIWKAEADVPASIDKSTLQSRTSGKKLSEFSFSIEKAETSGQYGKPQSYWDSWNDAIASGKAKKIQKATKSGKTMDAYEMDTTQTMYRIPNPDIIGNKNTIMKMAQKRAFVGAILLATGASEFFTQDIEDMEINGEVYSEKPTIIEEAVVVEEVVEIPKVWADRVGSCTTIEQLSAVYVKYKETIEANKGIKNLFTERKNSILNPA